MDIATVMAFQLVLMFCGDGQAINKNNQCDDGSEPNRREISFGVRHSNGEYNTVEINENNKPVFILHQDGTVTKAEGYKADKDAIAYWKAMEIQYQLCRFDPDTYMKPKINFRPKRRK